MGLAASQARLLSITSRMSDTELRSQLINNAKMRLTTDSAKVSDEYIAALNQTQMMFTNFDRAGNERYQNLTFNALTAYSSYNNQYGLVNNNGQLMVSSLDANNFVASGQDVNEFLRLYGLEQTTTYWDTLAASQEYRDYGVGYYDDFGEWQRFDVSGVDELQAMYEGTPDAAGIAHYGLEPSFNSVEYETYEILRGNYVAAKNAYNAELHRISNNYLKENYIPNVSDPSSPDYGYASTVIHCSWWDGSDATAGVNCSVEDRWGPKDITFADAFNNVFEFITDATAYVEALDDWWGPVGGSANTHDGPTPAIISHTFHYADDGISSHSSEPIFYFNGGRLWDFTMLERDKDSCVGIFKIMNMYIDLFYKTCGNILGLGYAWGEHNQYTILHDNFQPFNYTYIHNQNNSDLEHSSDGPAHEFIGNVNNILHDLEEAANAAMTNNGGNGGNTMDPYLYPGPSTDVTGDNANYAAGQVDCQQSLCEALALLGDLYSLVKTDLPQALDEEKLRADNPSLQDLFIEYQKASKNLARFIWGGENANDPPGADICDEMFGANAQYKYYEHLDDPAWVLSTYNEYPPETGIVQGSPHENPYYLQHGTTTTYDGQPVPTQSYAFPHIDPSTGAVSNAAQWMPTSYQAVRDILILQCMLDHYGEPKYTWIDVNNPDENAEAKVRWYTNLFNRMLQGYEIIPSGLENSSDWIQFAFESGMVHLEQVNTYDQWVSLMYSNCTGITESAVDVDITLAEAKYKREMAKIEAKDKRYDMELKTLDTEHETLKQEYEQIKKVIQKNIDRNMKMFQMG